MGFLDKIARMFSTPGGKGDGSYLIEAKCSRCGEIVQARVDLHNDLSVEYGEGEAKPTFFTRKVLMGENGRCFQRIEVELTFDANRELINREISGGSFINPKTE